MLLKVIFFSLTLSLVLANGKYDNLTKKIEEPSKTSADEWNNIRRILFATRTTIRNRLVDVRTLLIPLYAYDPTDQAAVNYFSAKHLAEVYKYINDQIKSIGDIIEDAVAKIHAEERFFKKTNVLQLRLKDLDVLSNKALGGVSDFFTNVYNELVGAFNGLTAQIRDKPALNIVNEFNNVSKVFDASFTDAKIQKLTIDFINPATDAVRDIEKP